MVIVEYPIAGVCPVNSWFLALLTTGDVSKNTVVVEELTVGRAVTCPAVPAGSAARPKPDTRIQRDSLNRF